MQASSVWTLGLRNLWRDLRAGELRLIIVAVLLAVAALTSVGFFADRLQGGLQRDARQLLGGDVVVVSDNPAPTVFVQQARQQGLQSVATARMLRMPSRAIIGTPSGGAKDGRGFCAPGLATASPLGYSPVSKNVCTIPVAATG